MLPWFSSMATWVQTSGAATRLVDGLIEVERDLLQARDDVADAVRFGRVLEHVGGEERVAQRFDV